MKQVAKKMLASPPSVAAMRALANRRYGLDSHRGNSKNYTRLVILGHHRTGSTLLVASLDQLPGVISFSEIFTRGKIAFYQPGYDNDSGLLRLYRRHAPLDFLERFVYRPYSNDVHCVSHKVFPNQVEGDDRAGLLDYYLTQPGLKFVHIKRRDSLAAYVSLRLADHTKRWSSSRGSYADVSLEFDPEDCLKGVRAFEDACRFYDDTFADKAPLEIWYEDLASDFANVMNRVQAHAGLSPEPLEPALKKQGQGDLSKSVANYDQVRQHLCENGFAHLFQPTSF